MELVFIFLEMSFLYKVYLDDIYFVQGQGADSIIFLREGQLQVTLSLEFFLKVWFSRINQDMLVCLDKLITVTHNQVNLGLFNLPLQQYEGRLKRQLEGFIEEDRVVAEVRECLRVIDRSTSVNKYLLSPGIIVSCNAVLPVGHCCVFLSTIVAAAIMQLALNSYSIDTTKNAQTLTVSQNLLYLRQTCSVGMLLYNVIDLFICFLYGPIF